jgi:hypothetical protein
MTIQEIQRLREEKPFKSFRILTADGRKYEVVRPKMLSQSPSGRAIAIGMPDDSFVTLDLESVIRIQRPLRRRQDVGTMKSTKAIVARNLRELERALNISLANETPRKNCRATRKSRSRSTHPAAKISRKRI